MKREFLINIAILATANLLIKPLYVFGIDRTVQNLLGPDVYGGAYAALLSYAYLFAILNDFGIQNFTAREISHQPSAFAQYFPHLLSLKGILAILYMAAVLGSAYFIGLSSSLLANLALLAFNLVLISFLFFFRSNIAALGHYRVDSLLSVADKFWLITIMALLIWGLPSFELKVHHFILAQTLSIVLSIGIALYVLGSRLLDIHFSLSLRWVWRLLQKSLPYAAVLFFGTIYTRVDSVMLKFLLPDGDYHAGVYAAAYRLWEMLNMFAFLFASLLLPMFARLYREGKSPFPLFRLGAGLLWMIGLLTALVFFPFRHIIMQVLYTHFTPYWGEVWGLLLWSFPASALSYVQGALLLAAGKVRKASMLYGIAAIANIALNAVYIPTFKAEGAALATLITQLAVVVMGFYLLRRDVLPQLQLRYLCRFCLFAIATLLTTLILEQLSIHSYMLVAVCALSIAGGFSLLWLYSETKSLKWKYWLEILKKDA